MFSIYINFLPIVDKHLPIHMYADNTLFHCYGTDLDVIQQCHTGTVSARCLYGPGLDLKQ